MYTPYCISGGVVRYRKWIDMEQYLSCGFKPLSFTRDRLQNQIARGNLCVIWAAEGFASLAEATGSDRYVKDGLRAVDYLVFTQCSWNPHYIYTAIPFGGFGVDNSDVTSFLDARQAETVKPLIWYAKKSGRQDLLERAVAAARWRWRTAPRRRWRRHGGRCRCVGRACRGLYRRAPGASR